MLKCYIEAENVGKENILLDVGGSDLFLENAQKLGIDVSDVDYAALLWNFDGFYLKLLSYFRLAQCLWLMIY